MDELAMDELAVYVHWPFCLAKCPYCDFNSHVAETVDQPDWVRAYTREISHTAGRTGPRRVGSVFFGGGTPSLMEPQTVTGILTAIGEHWDLPADAEVTLEANPTSVEAARLTDFAAAGVNRLSLGVQSLDATALTFLGRRHSVGETRAAIEAAAGIFARWSIDLIYGLPDQTLAAWTDALGQALRYAPGHVSAYQLTIERGTPFFAAQRGGDFILPGDETGADLYEATGEILAAAGLERYEISNYATPGEQCRHNLATWRYRDYAGIGPGAHGRLTLDATIHATRAIAAPAGWLAAVDEHGHGGQADEALDTKTVRDEFTMMGLRLADGFSRAAFADRVGRDFCDAFGPDIVAALVEAHLLIVEETGVRATAEGLVRLNGLLGRLLSDETR